MSDSAIWTRNGVNDARLVRNFSYVKIVRIYRNATLMIM